MDHLGGGQGGVWLRVEEGLEGVAEFEDVLGLQHVISILDYNLGAILTVLAN